MKINSILAKTITEKIRNTETLPHRGSAKEIKSQLELKLEKGIKSNKKSF